MYEAVSPFAIRVCSTPVQEVRLASSSVCTAFLFTFTLCESGVLDTARMRHATSRRSPPACPADMHAAARLLVMLLLQPVFGGQHTGEHLTHLHAAMRALELHTPTSRLAPLQVEFRPPADSEADVSACAGHEFYNASDECLRQPPSVSWGRSGEKFAVLMLDPDAEAGAASGRSRSGYLHWLVMNCDGSDMTSCDTVYKYQRPSDVRQTGRTRRRSKAAYPARRRYVFLLMKQSVQTFRSTDDNDRLGWSLQAFVDRGSSSSAAFASDGGPGVRGAEQTSVGFKPVAAGFIFAWHNTSADGKEEL